VCVCVCVCVFVLKTGVSRERERGGGWVEGATRQLGPGWAAPGEALHPAD